MFRWLALAIFVATLGTSTHHRWIGLVASVLTLAVGLWLLGSIARVVGERRAGWALLRGAQPPGS